MTFLTVEAFDLTEEAEETFARDFGVTIKDRSQEPFCVVFEGTRENLIAMFNEHWTDGDPDMALEADSPWLSEEYSPTPDKKADQTKFDHAYSLAFTVCSNNDAQAVTATELRNGIAKSLAAMSDEELVSSCGMPFNTIVNSQTETSR